MNTFIVADTHFSHFNIVRFCGRPFASVNEMDETLISNWNSVVGKEDLVYHLGDFSYKSKDIYHIANRLNGRIILVRGNHDTDKRLRPIIRRFEAIYDYKEVMINNQMILMFHYFFDGWKSKKFGSVLLHGHSHGKGPIVKGAWDVGVDNTRGTFAPLPIELAVRRAKGGW